MRSTRKSARHDLLRRIRFLWWTWWSEFLVEDEEHKPGANPVEHLQFVGFQQPLIVDPGAIGRIQILNKKRVGARGDDKVTA